MSKTLLLNKKTDKDPVTGTPIKELVWQWAGFYGQAKSNEGRYYQLLVPSHDKDHPAAGDFEAMEKDEDLCITRVSDSE